MVSIDGTCANGWLCISWEWLANNMYDTAFYGGLAGFVLVWTAARLMRRRRRQEEEVT